VSGRIPAFAIALVLVACGDDGAASHDEDSTGTDAGSSSSSSSDPNDSTDAGTDTSTSESSTSGSTTGADTSAGDSSESDSSSSSTGAPAACGDDTVDPGELCDDGNDVDDDGCDADCVPSVVVQIAGDFSDHTCVRTRTGAVRCWGRGASGRLGYAATVNVGDDEAPAEFGSVDVGGPALDLVAGAEHTCAVLDDGAVRCWGQNANGQLGQGNVLDVGDDEVPSAVAPIELGAAAVEVVAGAAHTCALLDDGAVQCWGLATDGQLGYGNVVRIGDDETPASAGDVDVGGDAVQIAAGASHTCALLDTGAVRCWGDNAFGQLGLAHTDTIGDDEIPSLQAAVVVLDVDEDDAVVAIAAAYGNTCVLLDSGNARCWGFSANGECGYGSTESVGDDETPASMGNLALAGTVVEINAGPCARLDTGDVRCWGLGDTGALGLGGTYEIGDDELPDTIDPIALGGAAVHQHSDGIHACAVLDTGWLYCWGLNDHGQLGLGDTEWIGDDPGETPDSVGPVEVF
jgi:cysteine-rich repeat protein